MLVCTPSMRNSAKARRARASAGRERRDTMARIVMKFGGTSVADLDRIRTVAGRVFGGLTHLARVRGSLPQLHASVRSEVLPVDDGGVLAIVRRAPIGPMVCLYNITPGGRPFPASRVAEFGLLRRFHPLVSARLATLAHPLGAAALLVLGAPAAALLDELPRYANAAGVPCPYVFPAPSLDRPLATLARLWDAVRHAAGLEDVRLHDLRHAFASVAASGGLTLPLIGALLGHTDSATTARYAHLVDSSRKRAAELTSGAVAAALAGVAAAGDAPGGPRVLPFARPA